MLAGQTAINFAANAFFGGVRVAQCHRLHKAVRAAEFGTYVLGFGFATTVSAFLMSWLRLPIMREQARGDGTDVRGIILPGFLLSCLISPAAYIAARMAGLENDAALAALGLALAVGFLKRPRSCCARGYRPLQ